jgi:branched-chain amino acid transport system permease protein
MDAQLVAQVVVLAAFYSLVGTGYVLVYRASRVLNFANGEFLMLCPYFLFGLTVLGRGILPLTVLLALVLTAVLAGVIYLATVRPMTGYPVFSIVLMTVGLAIVLRGVAELTWTAQARYPLAVLGLANQTLHLPGGATVTAVEAAEVGAAVAFIGGMVAFLRLARIGMQMRAAAEHPVLASQRGINIHIAFALSWALAAVGTGIAGLAFATNVRLEPNIAEQGLRALAVPLAGGLTSIPGTVIAALVVATSENLAVRYADPLLAGVVPHFVILAFIVLRPWGLLGEKEELERV